MTIARLCDPLPPPAPTPTATRWPHHQYGSSGSISCPVCMECFELDKYSHIESEWISGVIFWRGFLERFSHIRMSKSRGISFRVALWLCIEFGRLHILKILISKSNWPCFAHVCLFQHTTSFIVFMYLKGFLCIVAWCSGVELFKR